MKRIALFIVILFLVGFVIQAMPMAAASFNQTRTQRPTPVPTRWQDADETYTATVIMEKFILDWIETPSTAKFPPITVYLEDGRILRNGQKYSFRSWFDAQNPYGAMVRTHYVAEIEQIEPGTWRAISLVMEE